MEIKVCRAISMQICTMDLCAKRNKKLKTSAKSTSDLIAFWALQSCVPRTDLKSNPAHITPESCNLTQAYAFHRNITYHENLFTLHETRDLTCHSLFNRMWVFRKQESEITVKYHRIRCWIFNLAHGRGWNKMNSKVPSNLSHSVTLWFCIPYLFQEQVAQDCPIDFECLQEWRPHTLRG